MLYVPSKPVDTVVGFDPSGYAATSVLTGNQWFTVLPDLADSTLAMATYAYLTVPSESRDDFQIPVVDRDFFDMLYPRIDASLVASQFASQVLVVFERNGKRVSGIEVTEYPMADALAYDYLDGFSSDAVKTGAVGAVVLANVVGSTDLLWKESDGATGFLRLVHVPGRATFAQVSLP